MHPNLAIRSEKISIKSRHSVHFVGAFFFLHVFSLKKDTKKKGMKEF